jgi:hypothetical protein
LLRTRRYTACRRGGSSTSSFTRLAAAQLFLAQLTASTCSSGAEQEEHLLQRLGALLAEGQVVFAAAALVGVALDEHLHLRVGDEEPGMRLDQRLEFVLDDVAVVVEEDAALGQHALLHRRQGRAHRIARRHRLDFGAVDFPGAAVFHRGAGLLGVYRGAAAGNQGCSQDHQ